MWISPIQKSLFNHLLLNAEILNQYFILGIISYSFFFSMNLRATIMAHSWLGYIHLAKWLFKFLTWNFSMSILTFLPRPISQIYLPWTLLQSNSSIWVCLAFCFSYSKGLFTSSYVVFVHILAQLSLLLFVGGGGE